MKWAEGQSLDDVKRGEGKIIRLDGQKVAAYRDEEGKYQHGIGGVYAHGLHRALEPRRIHVGLPVPRLTISSQWRSPSRAGGVAAGGGDTFRT